MFLDMGLFEQWLMQLNFSPKNLYNIILLIFWRKNRHQPDKKSKFETSFNSLHFRKFTVNMDKMKICS